MRRAGTGSGATPEVGTDSTPPGVTPFGPASSTPAEGSTLCGGTVPPAEVENLGEALLRAARENGPGDICYLDDDGQQTRQSYPELAEAASRVLTGMRECGVWPGDKIIVHTSDGPSLLIGFWACILGGFVPIPVGPSASQGVLRGVDDLWPATDHVWLVTSTVDSAVTGEASGPESPVKPLGTVQELAGSAPADHYHPSDADDLAVLLLTSGSTGVPKAVMLSHRNILSRCVGSVITNQLTDRLRSFNWMPLDHVGGLLMFHVRDVYLRCTQVHAPMRWIMAAPLRWLDVMSQHRSMITWAPNFAFRLITDQVTEERVGDWDLSSLCHIMNGGEAIKPDVLRTFLRVLEPAGLPSDAIYPGWGMSETSGGIVEGRFDPTALHEEQRFLAIGEPHPGVDIRVVDDDGITVPDGTVGSLEVCGDPITTGYYNSRTHNRIAFTADDWYRTGDLGSIRDAHVVVTGRVDDLIDLDGHEYYAHEIESAVEELRFVEPTYTVAVAVSPRADPVARLGLFFHPRTGVDRQHAIAEITELITSRFGITAGYVLPVGRADIPRTGVGKLERAQVRTRFETDWIHDRVPGSAPMVSEDLRCR